MPVNGFYPISVTCVALLAWERSLNPLSIALLIAVVWANAAVHELGHAVAACSSGGSVTHLSIKPWHGMIRIHQRDRLGFALIALAGPAAGIAAGATALCVLGQISSASAMTAFGASLSTILWAGIWDNCFNLLPVGVLDGKQCLKALREWREERRALERLWRIPEAPPAPAPVVAVNDSARARDIPSCRLIPTPATSI